METLQQSSWRKLYKVIKRHTQLYKVSKTRNSRGVLQFLNKPASAEDATSNLKDDVTRLIRHTCHIPLAVPRELQVILPHWHAHEEPNQAHSNNTNLLQLSLAGNNLKNVQGRSTQKRAQQGARAYAESHHRHYSTHKYPR